LGTSVGLLAVSTKSGLSRRKPLPQPKGADQFHNNELGDVYDLYNACNGVMRGDRLDVQKLNELDPEELEALDVVRLREVWDHTATGCTICAGIIRTLNLARGTQREEWTGISVDEPER
jgi:hypothetical protein